MEKGMILTGLCVTLVVLCLSTMVDASCQEMGVCCRGLNSSCYTEGISMRQKEGKCYCDESCVKTLDCCTDFREFCEAQDCEVSEWEDWGKCSRECGEGKTHRRRKVIKDKRNGGGECPKLTETRPCIGRSCHQRRDTFGRASRETARIIPARFGKWRTNKMYDITRGIRKNLFYHYSRNEIITKPSYCAKYELVNTRRACKQNAFASWAQHLKKGTTVCVECQVTAMRRTLGVRCSGHGAFEQMTRWKAMNVFGCHGYWIMKTHHKPCTCDPKDPFSFIFV